MKKLNEFEGLDEFGYVNIGSHKNPNYVLCDNEFPELSDTSHGDVFGDSESSPGSFMSMEDILNGNSITGNITNAIYSSATLAIDYTDTGSLAYFGSVYAVVASAINNIKSTYPNGFLIVDGSTGTTTFTFDHNNTVNYDSSGHILLSYNDYQFVQVYDGSIDEIFQISSWSTGANQTTLTLDGTPSTGALYDFYVEPKESTLDKYYSSLKKYELDLLVPPYNRSNYWPRDPLAPNNILLSNSSYEEFVETELNDALDSDNEYANVLWRRLYPDGQKILDSDDGIAQKLILTYGASFDLIKRYQDQLRNQHTVGYSYGNHVSKEVVSLLANQWNFSLGHNLNQSEYEKYLYATYDNYITGYSEQKISQSDVNFEIWRRVLTNLVSLYKRKGTKESLMYIANLYDLPEGIFSINEIVEEIDSDPTQTKHIISESNIVIPLSGSLYYVDQYGEKKELSAKSVKNTKYLDVETSVANAIEYDFYTWGWENHPDIIDVNGNLITISSATQPSQTSFINSIVRSTIKSDGTAKYDKSYPLLENEAKIYYTGSSNKFSYNILQPYMNFLDDNWNIMVKSLIPSSSRILGEGTVYRNVFWNRQKFQWNDSERDLKSLPFQEEKIFNDLVVPVAEYKEVLNPFVDVFNVSSSKMLDKESQIPVASIDSENISQKHGVVDFVTLDSVAYQKMESAVDLGGAQTDYVQEITDVFNIDASGSGYTKEVGCPIIEPISGQYGTLDYVDYTDDSIVVSIGNTFDVTFSAYNLSDSGFTLLRLELFRKQYETPIMEYTGKTYSIMGIVGESSVNGVYNISSSDDLELYDTIKIESEYVQFLNEVVKVVGIDSKTNQLRTEPPIGISFLPMGEYASAVDWNDFKRSDAIYVMRSVLSQGISYEDLIYILKEILRFGGQTNISTALAGMDLIRQYASSQSLINELSWFFGQSQEILNACVIVLGYTKDVPGVSIDSDVNAIVDGVVNNFSKATFRRIVDFFDWQNPIKSYNFSNHTGYGMSDSFNIPELDYTARTDSNSYSTTGTVSIGGLDSLNSNVLVDKQEYFLRYKAVTHAPLSWGKINGMLSFPAFTGSMVDSEYDMSIVNNIKYYGRYFMYMKSPKQAIPTYYPTSNDSGATPTTDDASVTISWKGVSDSSRMELQFLSVYSSDTPYDSYSAIPTTAWSESATTVAVQVRNNVGDDYIYTIQTTLDENTYYWWRIKNFKSKVNIFGNNLERYSATQPRILLTGGYKEGGSSSGEVIEDPQAPTGAGTTGTKGDFSEQVG